MTFEEVYKILYEKYDIARADYSDKRIKIKSSIAIDTYDLFDLIEGLKETYAPKIKMTTQEFEFFNSCYKTNDSRGFKGFKVFIDANGKKIGISHINLHAWLHPELIEVVDE